MVTGTRALSDHCSQAVATACLVTLGSLQEPRRHVCLPPAPGVDWAEPRCGQVTDLLKEWTLKVLYLKNSELAKASQFSLSIMVVTLKNFWWLLFSDRKLTGWVSYFWLTTCCLKTVTPLPFTPYCVWVRQRGIISPFARDVSSTPVIASSSPTSTEEGPPTADTYLDTDEE